MKTPPLSGHGGCWRSAWRAEQIAKQRSFALRQPAALPYACSPGLEMPRRELLSGGGQHFGFKKWGDEEFTPFAEGFDLRLEGRNVTIPLGSQENAEHAGHAKPRLGGKLSAFLLVDYDHIRVQLSGKRNGFGFNARFAVANGGIDRDSVAPVRRAPHSESGFQWA